MSVCRFLLSCSRRYSTAAPNLLRRSGPSKRIQFRYFSKSSKNDNRGLGEDPMIPVKEIQGSSTSWGTIAIPAAAVLGFAGLATFIRYNDERRVTLKGEGNCSGANIVKGPIIGGPFTLVDTENRIVTEKNLLGNWVLLYFGYTSSPDIGPEQIDIMVKAIEKLESKHNAKVLPVFVTIDPQRDTPDQLRAYLKEFKPRIIGLTGSVSAVRQMAQEYRVFYRKVEEVGKDDYLVESSHNMYLMSPTMEIMRCFGVEYNADELSEEIVKELNRNPVQ